jgi:transposase InsO family protein
MIEEAVEEITPIVGTRCRALGAAHATVYRRRRPPEPRPPRPRLAPARALSDAERQAVLGELRSERFVDSSPAQVWATLLDEGRYLASERTMYRLLAARGEVSERRDQLAHPAYERPELLAERANEVWSWDISKLKGPAKWTYFYLYAVLDVFSRYAVAWTVQQRESGPVAEALIAQAIAQQQISRADGARRPRQLDDLQAGRDAAGRSRRDQDPQPALHLDRQPLLGGAVQDAQVPAGVPGPVRLDRARTSVLAASSSAGTTTITATRGSA